MVELRNETVLIENADVMFLNLAGRPTPFNTQGGERSFCVMLDKRPDILERLTREGWNVKHLKPREEGDEPRPYLEVKANYSTGRPPRVAFRSSRGYTELGADEVAQADVAQFKNVDLIIRPYHWKVNGNEGVKAYLKTAIFTLDEDELELKYAEEMQRANSDLKTAEDEAA